ncbi:baculoviral IAP repeat-containing protein 7 [Eublepharis macularius]|uniref:RING-type E3 ubiquitin transferase n=1 Tax=Eublepharis macularius TaxID=481883 RepID=A0AA97JGZ6_EUBMA|nr:baculoviral IAP repeat-containing protein 7 [Eublepharis macularius]
MQADNMRDALIATGTQLVARVLTNLLSGNWDMGDNSSPEDARNRNSPLPSTMTSEERRLRTFQCWPDSAAVSPADLAAAGFFFVGPGDRVKCFCCGGVLYEWVAEDDPIEEHRKFFPMCPFIQGIGVGSQRAPRARGLQDCVDGQFLGMLQNIGMEEEAVPDSPPEYPNMEMEDNRLVTFNTWPSSARVSPELLARAGFFYTGEGDYVRCFHCDGALRNWERGDDPWMEHARWFPRCKFLLQSRGRDFVNTIQESYLGTPASSEDPSNEAEQDSSSSEDSLGNLDLVSPELTSMMQTVLQMGFHQALVSSLLQLRFQQMGASYPSLSDLVLDLLQAVQDQGSQAEETREPAQREPDLGSMRREAEPSEGESTSNVEAQLRRLREERMCKVCMDKEVSIVLIPCGHLVVCAECVPNLRRCPICRGVIRDTVRAFMS